MTRIVSSLGNSSSKSFEYNVDGQGPELRAVTPAKGGVIPARGTIYTVELHDSVAGVDLDSVTLTALAKPSGQGRPKVFQIITKGKYLYGRSKLNTKRGERIAGPKFKFMLRRTLSPGIITFTIKCKDLIELPMEAKWQFKIK